ncbi:MAG: Crp/Fnr family transcriptional regulator [Cyclobacteriaceae bacterium]|nr:Crp/Fnr family transcriptional regulator [Cyclobacteriaceae bacterium HetDA_MAG_MS6]
MPDKEIDCYSCPNQDCMIRKHIRDDQAIPFLAKRNTLYVRKGQSFIMEGAPVHGLYFIRDGKVKVAKIGINGKEQIVRFGGPGEIIGHRGFGAGQFYQINAETIENSILCGFSNDVMKHMLQALPSLTYDMMIFYAEELNRSETKVKKFAQMTVREKVIDALLYVHRKFGQDEYLNVQLSRKEIADFAGTTEEQVIRVISGLKKEGLLKTKGRMLAITDMKLLSSEIAVHNYFLNS